MKAKVSYPEVPFIQIDNSISAFGYYANGTLLKIDLVIKVIMSDTIKFKLNFTPL